MKLLHSLLLAPVLSLAATNGSVTLLDGTPIAGAVIKSLTDSAVTTANGSFALDRATGIASRSSKTIPVTSHLVVENGRPRLSFAGMDISGRPRNSAATARQIPSNPVRSLSARSVGTQDTLKVYWKGKRLTVLPVTSDTTVTFRIDTAWKDDAGIPWNPTITYGSLFDSRDGQTYRTVEIPELSGDQTWMAENLNFKTDSSWIFSGIDSTEMTDQGQYPFLVDSMGTKYGRYYQWAAALRLPDSCLAAACSTSSQGVCPTGWHIPSMEQWGLFHTYGPRDSTIDSIIGTALKAAYGWGYLKRKTDSLGYGSPNGRDLAGFRALNTGAKLGPTFNQHIAWGWWSNADLGIYYAPNAFYLGWIDPWRLGAYEGSKRTAMPVRCLKD